jgi:hydrogenase-4 membrane subunit HyfE
VSGRSALIIIYSLFWAAVFIMLGISLHMGLNSTYVWYTEETSFNMYLAMTLTAIVVLEATLILYLLHRRRVLRRDPQLWQRPLATFLPMILLSMLFLTSSVFALASLHGYLEPEYKVNTVFIIFTGSLSKIAVGLFAVMAFRTGLRSGPNSRP